MNRTIALTAALTALVTSVSLATPAAAFTRESGGMAGGSRAQVSDPDAGLERLAAASTRSGGGHGQPAKSNRTILRDDPNLQRAFSWLNNR